MVVANEHIPSGDSFIPEEKLLIITKAFMIILPVLAKYICTVLQECDKNNWWQRFVLNKLINNRDLPKEGTDDEYMESLDMSACLNIIKYNWEDIFRQKMQKKKYLDCAHSLLTIRNEESHFTIKKLNVINDEEVGYALSIMILFMRPIDTGVADKISEMKMAFENKYNKSEIKHRIRNKNTVNETQEIDGEIKKIQRKINRWFKEKEQYNSRILYAFIKLFNENEGDVTYDQLKTVASIGDAFKRNFDQMKNFGAQNHGKIFDQIGENIYLWEKVEDIIWRKCKEYNIKVDETLI